MNKQPYELSIWRDKQKDNSTLSYFGDEKVAIIASNTMESPFKAYDVTLKEQSNGDKTLTFSMLYEYINNGKKEKNPFFELLSNETKLKLRNGEAYSPFDSNGKIITNNNNLDTDKRWSDFIVKTIDKDSTTHVANIVAKELHVNELSKNGWSVTLNTELENNYGTVTELAEKVLKGSNWEVNENSYSPIEGIEEPLFEYVIIENELAANGIENGQNLKILKEEKIYFFYKDVEFNEEEEQWQLKEFNNTQFLYFGKNKDINSASKDDNLVIIDDNYQYNYITNSLSKDIHILIPKNINGRRIQNKQRVKYESVLDRYVDVYKNDSGNQIYGYKNTEYSVSPIVQNYIVNSVNFTSNTGWKSVDTTVSDPILTLYPSPEISDNAIKVDGVENILVFENGKRYTNNGPTISGLRTVIDEEYILRFRGRWVSGNSPKIQNYSLNFYLKEDTLKDLNFSELVTINIDNSKLNNENGFLIPSNERQNPESENLGQLYIDEKGYGYCKFKANYNSLKNHNIVIDIAATAAEGEFYLSDIQLFKYEIGDREVKEIVGGENNQQTIKTEEYKNSILFPGDSPKSNIEEKTVYYSVNDNDDITYYASLPAEYSEDKATESVRFFETRESNYFNNIQSLAELFEVWVGFEIEHYQDGRTVYQEIRDENNEIIGYQPIKKVTFYRYSPSGKDNYAGFKYGINLEGIKRNTDSTSIASKVIVKPNNQEYATDGMCTIARAPSNQTGETEILNFDYYINQGLLDGNTVINDLYGTSNSHFRYYPKIKKCNDIIHENSLLVSKYSNTIAELKKYYDLYEAEILSYKNEIDELSRTYKNFNTEDEKRIQYQNEIARLTILLNTAETNRDNIKREEVINEEKITLGSLQQYLDWSDLAQKNIDEQTEEKEKLKEILYNKYYRFLQEGTWTDEAYVDDELYYLEASKIAAVSAFPQVSYVINVLSIDALEEYEPYKFNVGDRTYIEDVEFFGYIKTSFDSIDGIKTPYRMEVIVSEKSNNFDDPSKTTITIKNYKNQFEELFQKITATTQSLQYKTGEYARAANAITPTGEIKVSTLEQSFKNNSMILSSSDNQSVIWDTGTGIEVIDNKNANNRVRVVGGGVFISNDGGGTWSNAISGSGINTKYLIAGQIDASKINLVNGSIPYFRWDTKGISAFEVTEKKDENGNIINTSYDLNRYVRFNQYGIYAVGPGGIKGENSIQGLDFDSELEGTFKDDFGKERLRTFSEKLKFIEDNSSFSLTWKGLSISGGTGEWQAVKLDAEQGLRLLNSDYKFTAENLALVPEDFRKYGTGIGTTYEVGDEFPILAIGQFPNIEEKPVYGIRLRNSDGFITFMTDNRGEIWATDRLFIGPWNDKTSATSTTGLNARTITLEQLNAISNSQFKADLSESPDLIAHSIRIWAGGKHDEIEKSPFLVLENGSVIASNAYISGDIQATSGNISGLLTIGNGKHGIDGSSEANPIIWGGKEGDTYKFWIDSDGILHAEGAEISGTIGAAETTVKKLLIPDEQSGGIDSTGNVRIWINEETENDRETSVFYVTAEGHLHTKEAYLDGNLYITKNEDGSYQSGISNGIDDGIILYAGAQSNDRKSAVFTVDKEGNVIAKSITLGGSFIAKDGLLNIGTIIVDGINGIIHTANSSSVAGWSIDEDGNAQFNNINARGEIKSAVFTHNSVNTMGGDLYLTPVYYDYENTVKTNKGNYEIIVDELVYDNEVWAENGDITFSMLIDGKEYNNIPATLTKNLEEMIYSFIITPKTNDLNIDSTKTPTNFSINSLVGCGIRLSAGDSNGPNIAITKIDNNSVVLTQIGSLEGVSDINFGQLKGIGLYSQNAYLTGSLFLPNAGITDKERINKGDESSPVRIWAGAAADDRENAPFRVTQDGTLYAEKGIFSGVVQAKDSTFSGWLETTGILIDDNQITCELIHKGEIKEEYKFFYRSYNDITLETILNLDRYKNLTDEEKNQITKNGVEISNIEGTITLVNEDKIKIKDDTIIIIINFGTIYYKDLINYIDDFNLDEYTKNNNVKEGDNIPDLTFSQYKTVITSLPDYCLISDILNKYNLDIDTFNKLNPTENGYTENDKITESLIFTVNEDPLPPNSIFYVAYDRNYKTNFPEYDDKIIQIDKNGLSIWEGGFNVYSDYASGWRKDKWDKNLIESYYGYSDNNKNNYPYIKAIDDENYRLYTTNLNIGKFNDNTSSFINIKNGKISFINYINQIEDFTIAENESFNKEADWRLYSENGILIYDFEKDNNSQKIITLSKNSDKTEMEIKGKLKVDDEIITYHDINFISGNEEIVVNIKEYINNDPNKTWDRGIDFVI